MYFWQTLTPMSLVLMGVLNFIIAQGVGWFIARSTARASDRRWEQWLNANEAILTNKYFQAKQAELNIVRAGRTAVLTARVRSYRVACFILLNIFLALSPSAGAYALFSFIFIALLYVSGIELESGHIAKGAVLFLAIVLIGVNTLSLKARWVTPQLVLFGLFVTTAFSALSVALANKSEQSKAKQREGLIFDNNSTLIFAGLSLYFGIDVLIAMGIGVVIQMVFRMLNFYYFNALVIAGCFPLTADVDEATGKNATPYQMTFMPSFFIGMLVVTLLTMTGLVSFSDGIEVFYMAYLESLAS